MLYLFCKLRKFGVLVISSQWTPQLCNLCCSSHVCCLWHQFSVHHIFHGSFNKDLPSSLVYVCRVGFCKLLYVCVHSCILQYIFLTFYCCIYLGFNWGFREADTCTEIICICKGNNVPLVKVKYSMHTSQLAHQGEEHHCESKVSCPREHNTVFPARTWTHTACSRFKHSNHEAILPLTNNIVLLNWLIIDIIIIVVLTCSCSIQTHLMVNLGLFH